MAIVIESSSTAGWATGDCTITKPTGLAEGDLMIACICAEDDNINTLSGWTELQEASAGSNQTSSSLQYKVADSGDVAASNFTFVRTNADGDTAGAILRVSGYAPTALFSDSETEVDINSATQIDAGVTLDPITNGELIIVVSCISQVSSTSAVSSPAINGTNPTWTEVLDTRVFQAGSDYAVAYIAYATQTTAAQITSFTATVSATTSSSDGATVIATLSPQTSVTGTFTHLSVSPTLFSGAVQIGVTGTFPRLSISPTINSPSAIAYNNGAVVNAAKTAATVSNTAKNTATMSNQAKASSNWTNTNKA